MPAGTFCLPLHTWPASSRADPPADYTLHGSRPSGSPSRQRPVGLPVPDKHTTRVNGLCVLGSLSSHYSGKWCMHVEVPLAVLMVLVLFAGCLQEEVERRRGESHTSRDHRETVLINWFYRRPFPASHHRQYPHHRSATAVPGRRKRKRKRSKTSILGRYKLNRRNRVPENGP